jgi:hypothetical protein
VYKKKKKKDGKVKKAREKPHELTPFMFLPILE